MELVSVVVPTYNRFKFLLNTIKSIKNQTHENIEIIVVNDKSTEKEYYSHNWESEGVKMIHLEQNTKNKFKFPCAGYVRNIGIDHSNGKYVAFCDDDDIWFPKKLELQIKKMKETGCKMSSTDGLIGKGVYNPKKKYKKYNAEHYYSVLQRIYKKKGKNELANGFPLIWDLKFIKIHNCIITSSVVIEKDILTKINNFKNVKNAIEDYDCWKRALSHTKLVYLNDICFYYDLGHGTGRNY